MTAEALTGGFAAPAQDSARAFRALLTALSRPGTIQTLDMAAPPVPLSPAAGTLALTLLDGTTPVYLAPGHDTQPLRDWLAFHTGAPMVAEPQAAAFAFGRWEALQPLDRFAFGTPEYPDRAATLVIELPELRAAGARLTGPGLADAAYLSLPDVMPFKMNSGLFPLGYDKFLTCGTQLAALPRSTSVEEA
jgi:alpha-D-ribose 1-methylphosphonate 5-triphosphate synthase subunit PhnH